MGDRDAATIERLQADVSALIGDKRALSEELLRAGYSVAALRREGVTIAELREAFGMRDMSSDQMVLLLDAVEEDGQPVEPACRVFGVDVEELKRFGAPVALEPRGGLCI